MLHIITTLHCKSLSTFEKLTASSEQMLSKEITPQLPCAKRNTVVHLAAAAVVQLYMRLLSDCQ